VFRICCLFEGRGHEVAIRLTFPDKPRRSMIKSPRSFSRHSWIASTTMCTGKYIPISNCNTFSESGSLGRVLCCTFQCRLSCLHGKVPFNNLNFGSDTKAQAERIVILNNIMYTWLLGIEYNRTKTCLTNRSSRGAQKPHITIAENSNTVVYLAHRYR